MLRFDDAEPSARFRTKKPHSFLLFRYKLLKYRFPLFGAVEEVVRLEPQTPKTLTIATPGIPHTATVS